MVGLSRLDRLAPGQVFWAELDGTKEREQSGRRPAIVISSQNFNDTVTALVWIVPVTSVNRGWRNHIALRGVPQLEAPSFAMTEQIRTVSRDRLVRYLATVDRQTLHEIRVWISDFLAD